MGTINHESYVSLEIAKLLKKAGFYWDCYELYEREYEQDGRTHAETPVNWNSTPDYYSAPTLEVAQRWLREVKDISVDISSTRYSEWEYAIRKINQLNNNDNTILTLTACRFYTYEEAKEAGIKSAIEIILEEGETSGR
jgi:hypothetical protein